MTDVSLARRAVMAGAGAGLVGLATRANAQTAKPAIQASEYWTQKGDTQLANGDRQYVILPQTAHSLGFAKNRHLLFYAVRNFLQAPAAIPAA